MGAYSHKQTQASERTSASLRNNWTDAPCYYVSVIDGERKAVLAGPYRTHESALADVDIVNRLAQTVGDPGAWFYAYGTCKLANGYREGLLNARLMDSVPMGSWTGESNR